MRDKRRFVAFGSSPGDSTSCNGYVKTILGNRVEVIADLLHRIDFIEKAGTGVKRIRDESRDGGHPEPVWEADGFVTTIFRPNPDVRAMAEAQAQTLDDAVVVTTPQQPPKYPRSTPEVAPEVAPEVMRMLAAIKGKMRRTEIQAKLGLGDEKHFREHYQQPAIAQGLVEMTIPEKPNSRLQKYRLTDRGRAALKKHEGETT